MRKFFKFLVLLCLMAGMALGGFVVGEKFLTKDNMTLEIARKQMVEYCTFINEMESDFSSFPEEQDYNKEVVTHSSEIIMFVPFYMVNILHSDIKENTYYNINLLSEENDYFSNIGSFYFNFNKNNITLYMQNGDYNYVMILDTLKDDNDLQTLKLYLFYEGSYNGNFYYTNYYNYIELKSNSEKIVNYTEYTLFANYDSSKPSDTLNEIANKTTYQDAEYYNCNLLTNKLYSKDVPFTQYLEQVKGVSPISFDTVLTNKNVDLQFEYGN